MSIKIMNRVWEQSKQGGSQLLLLLAIADNANDDGYAWPGQEYLAKKIRMHKRSIPRLIKKLQETGDLFVNDRSGKGKSTQYIVLTGMDWVQFSASLQCHFKYTVDEILEIGKWFESQGGMTNCQGGVDIAVPGGDDKLSGGVDIAVSTEPSITNKETPINREKFSKTEKGDLNRLAPFVAEQIDNKNRSAADMPTKDELRQMVLFGYRLSKELCPLSIPGASRTSLEALARTTLLIWAEPEKEEKFRNWWYNEYWAGKKGQSPTPSQVGDTWGQFEQAGKPVKKQPPNHEYTPPSLTSEQVEFLKKFNKVGESPEIK